MIDVILGLQWGDEGKGKIVDYFAKDYPIIARFQGGPNAGHTLYINNDKVVLHQIPSGIFHQDTLNLIGNGVVLDPITLQREADTVHRYGVDVRTNLYVSNRTQIIIPSHRALDKASESAKGKDKIGSTLKGIGPAYMDKTGRNGLRVGDILEKDFEARYKKLKEKHLHMLQDEAYAQEITENEPSFFASLDLLRSLHIVEGTYFLHEEMAKGKNILAEGAQGTMLDIDFGTYPFVTSSNTISAGVCTGLGVAPSHIGKVIGITKAYCTRVGSGPFPTELHDETGEHIRKAGNEFGSTTGRPRRCGWIDLIALNYACMINGVTEIVMTKADVLDDMESINACTAYEIDGEQQCHIPYQFDGDSVKAIYQTIAGWNTPISDLTAYNQLPETLKNYIQQIVKFTKIPISYISNGPHRNQLLKI